MVAHAAQMAVILAVQNPVLDYKDGNYRLTDSRGPRIILARPQPKTAPLPPVLSLKHNGLWIVWDARGLTRRSALGTVFSTKFEEAATSPKIQTTDELLLSQPLIASGQRQRAASSLMGYELVQNTLYCVMRWEDTTKKPWLEAIFSIDLTNPTPKPVLVGKFPGFIVGPGNLRDLISLKDNKLCAVIASDNKWGYATWDLMTMESAFVECGSGVANCMLSPAGDEILFTQRTDYGTTIAGTVRTAGNRQRLFAETRGTIGFLSVKPLVLAVKDARGDVLVHAESGVQLTVPNGSQFRATPDGVLVWSPERKPTRATLFNEANWSPIAIWTSAPASQTLATTAKKQPLLTARSNSPRKKPGKPAIRPPK